MAVLVAVLSLVAALAVVAAVIAWSRSRRAQAELAALRAGQLAVVPNGNRSRSEFLSRTSHELRTPLNAVLGFSQLLELEDLTDHQRAAVGHIATAGRRLLTLIDEVLDLARIEGGNLNLAPEPVALGSLIAESTELVASLAADRQVGLRDEAARGCDLTVFADRGRTKQILINLLSNAVKYNRDGGHVLVECTEVEGRVRIAVTDSGPGIADEHLPRLFHVFERLDADRVNVEGTGLGLALSKQLAEAMGGTVDVTSELGRGSTFTLELPSASSRGLYVLEGQAPP